jgi:sigma-E factor negative regulatory protein RseA
MQEQINERISLLIDDELDKEQALSLLKAIQTDEALTLKLQRYQLLGQVLKNQPSHLPDARFAEKIHQQIQKEPIHFLPARKTAFNWQVTGFAIAASTLLAVVWLVSKIDSRSYSFQPPQLASSASLQQHQPDIATSRFNDYLQAHDNSVYINNVARVQPYARVVGYQQE